MTLLDRYIARQFLANAALLFVILCAFVVVIDASLNMDRFMRLAHRTIEQSGGQTGTLREVLISVVLIADLWWPKLLQLYNFLLGMVMVAAMGFTCTQLTRHREFIAMMAAGVGLHRVMRPILIVALSLTALQIVNQEVVIPRIGPLLVREHRDAGNHRMGVARVPLTLDGEGRLFRADAFDADTGEMRGVYILERDGEARATRAILADSATYRAGGWDLVNGRGEARGRSGMGVSGPVDRVESSLDPDELRMKRYDSYRQALGFGQLGKMLGRTTLVDPGQRAALERLRWGRFAVMGSSLLSLVIAMPFYIRREPTNMAIQSLKCAPFAIVALIGGILGASASIPGVPAALGVFIPVMILSVVAVAQASALKT